jgi:methionyl-tRNA formyltransferase
VVNPYGNAVFLGSKSFGLSVFKSVFESSRDSNITWHVFHPDDKNDDRSNLSEWKSYVNLNRIQFTVVPKTFALIDSILSLKPNIGFVCGWYSLIKEEILEVFPMGLWGIHNSLLPKYRGHAPLVWSIINGEELVGSTCFRISSGVDDGPILFQVQIPNRVDDNIQTLMSKIEDAVLGQLEIHFRLLILGQIITKPQNEEIATYCSRRTPEDGRINWRLSALDIHNFIRAQTSPYPGAFFQVASQKIFVLNSEIFESEISEIPGKVLKRDKDSFLVACGKRSAIRLFSFRANGRRLDPSELSEDQINFFQ